MMSIETLKIAQDKHELITNGTHTPIISQLLNILKYNNSLLLPFSAISNKRIEFTKGLFALFMAQNHQTAFLQLTNEIHIQSSIPIIQPIFTLDVGHLLSGETQRKSSYLWPFTWPQPCEAQAKDPQSAFMSLPINKYMHTSRARASRVTEVSRGGRTYKVKGEPIGTASDSLAGTAVDCVISKTLSLTFPNSRHLCLMMPQSLDLACF